MYKFLTKSKSIEEWRHNLRKYFPLGFADFSAIYTKRFYEGDYALSKFKK